MKSIPSSTKPTRTLKLIICPTNQSDRKPDGHARQTHISVPKKHLSIDVVGGSETVHDSNVEIAKSISKLPNSPLFSRRVRRMIERKTSL